MQKAGKRKLIRNRKFLIQTSIKIAGCQKILLNYEIANNILSTLYNREVQHIKDDLELVFIIVYEYADLKFLCFDYAISYNVLVSWEKMIVNTDKNISKFKNQYSKLLLLKAKILCAIGDYTASEEEINKFKTAYDTKYNLHYMVEQISLELNRCQYKNIEKKLDSLMSEVNLFDSNEGLMHIKERVFTMYLKYYYDNRNLEKFEEYLNLTADLFKIFDQFRLLKNCEFLSFIYYKILYFLYKHKYSHALNRINNILNNITYENDKAYYFSFSLLKSEILLKSMKFDEAMDILKELLNAFDLKAFNENSFKNYDVFKKIHIKMAICYYKTFKYTNALKCLKFVVLNYYENNRLFKNKDFMDKDYCKIHYLMAKIYNRTNDFKRMERHLEKSQQSMLTVYIDQYHPVFFKLFIEYFKFFMNYSDLNSCKGYLDKAELIIKRQYGKNINLYINTAILYKHMGNYFKTVKEYQKCLDSYKLAIKIIEDIISDDNDLRLTAIVNEMAHVCIIFDKLDLAQSYLKKCEKINKKKPYGELELAKTYYYMGHYYKKISNFEHAIKSYNKAKEQYAETYQNEMRLDIVRCYYGIASLYHMKKKNSDSLNLLEDCQNILRTIHKHNELDLATQINAKIGQVRKSLAN